MLFVNPNYNNYKQQTQKNKDDIEDLQSKIKTDYKTASELSEDSKQIDISLTNINPSTFGSGWLYTANGLLFNIVDIVDNIVIIDFYTKVAKGQKGDPGESNTLSIGEVKEGEVAQATITGLSPNQTLNLTLPRGEKGDKGDIGRSNTLFIGEVKQGDVAEATITGEAPTQILNLTLPRGEKGDKGDPGDAGNATSVKIPGGEGHFKNLTINGSTYINVDRNELKPNEELDIRLDDMFVQEVENKQEQLVESDTTSIVGNKVNVKIDNTLSEESIKPIENKVVTSALKKKQDTLTAGANISIENNVISASGGGKVENLTFGNSLLFHPTQTKIKQFDKLNLWYYKKKVHYTSYSSNYILNEETNDFDLVPEEKILNFTGSEVWYTQENVYYYDLSSKKNYRKNKENDEWEICNITGVDALYGSQIVNLFGNTYFFENSTNVYIFRENSLTFEPITISGKPNEIIKKWNFINTFGTIFYKKGTNLRLVTQDAKGDLIFENANSSMLSSYDPGQNDLIYYFNNMMFLIGNNSIINVLSFESGKFNNFTNLKYGTGKQMFVHNNKLFINYIGSNGDCFGYYSVE